MAVGRFSQFYEYCGRKPYGVMSANEYLTRVNLMRAAVLTAILLFIAEKSGDNRRRNTAMDAVRTARRLGAEKQ